MIEKTRVKNTLDRHHIWHWLIEPARAIRGNKQRKDARLLSLLLLTLVPVTLVHICTVALFTHSPRLPVFALMALILIAGYALSRTRYYTGAVILTIVSLIALVIISLEMETDRGELPTRAHIVWLALTVIVSGLFLSPRSTIIVSSMLLAGIPLLPLVIPQLPLQSVIGGWGFVLTASLLVIITLYHRNQSPTDIAGRKRAQESLARRAQEMAALNRVMQEIVRLQSLDTLLDHITASALHLLGRQSGGISLYRPDRKALEWVVNVGEELAPIGFTQRKGEGLAGKVWITGQVQTVHNYDEWAGKLPHHHNLKATVISVPIQRDDEFLGVLTIADSSLIPFDEYEISILSQFAIQSAIAIQNARLYEQAQQEIAERKRAQESLNASLAAQRESEQMLRLIFESAFDGISVYEEFADGRPRKLLDCNARYTAIAGRSKTELLRIGDPRPIQTGIDQVIEIGQTKRLNGLETYRGRFSWQRPDGQENIIEYAAVRIHTQGRQLIVGIDRDITEQTHAAQERQALIAELETKNAELETKNAELERFTYTVSHDLKSPLITIKGFLGFLEQDARSNNIERLRGDIERIANAADKMQLLLDDLLELSRIGRLQNPIETMALADVARDAAELVAGELAEHGIQIDIADNLPTVIGDRPRLREVFENLLGNAAKFMGNQPQPRIKIGARQQDGQMVFYVSDNGIGIEAQYQEKVFDLFEKLDPDSEGTGIGLAVVKRIIETHGGHIWIESKGVDQGTCFCFTLPQPKP